MIFFHHHDDDTGNNERRHPVVLGVYNSMSRHENTHHHQQQAGPASSSSSYLFIDHNLLLLVYHNNLRKLIYSIYCCKSRASYKARRLQKKRKKALLVRRTIMPARRYKLWSNNNIIIHTIVLMLIVVRRGATAFGRFHSFVSRPFLLSHHHPITTTTTTRTIATALSSTSGTNSNTSTSIMETTTSTTTTTQHRRNPLLRDWSTEPFHLPPFSEIDVTDFQPALEEGMKQQLMELQHIIDNPNPPTFDTVIVPYDRCGSLLDRVSSVYGNMCSSLNTNELQTIQTIMSPILSRHTSKVMTLPGLFDKIKIVYEQISKDATDSTLTVEQHRLVERIYMDFTRSGAHFNETAQDEYTEIKATIASLMTKFMQNVMKDESTYQLLLTKHDLQGCPLTLIEAAKQAAIERNHTNDDDYVITLSRSLVEPFLMYADNRKLRKQLWEAWTTRGQGLINDNSKDNNNNDDGSSESESTSSRNNNIPIATQLLKLRLRQAQLHGYKNFAEYQCVDRMAKTPEAVMTLLENVWNRAKLVADRERQAMELYLEQSGIVLVDDDEENEEENDGSNNSKKKKGGTIQPWDWRYVAEKVRKEQYDFDESLLKPYLSLDSVRTAMFAVSSNLFDLEYIPLKTTTTTTTMYHPDVEAYEVRNRTTKKLVALFLHDNYSRPFKSSGAWMSEYRSQTKNLPDSVDPMEGIPIVSNNNNFAKGEKATFLSHDDATTMFHEFGHGHHGMLSDATYGRLASTNVLSDFVELPSQLFEHWFSEREVLNQYARHHETGEPVPSDLLDKMEAAKTFNQGFDTIEYTSCALFDMAVHKLDNYDDDFDLVDFERKEMNRLGLPQGIIMRHRPAHFAHLFASQMYASGYYVYLWAETLDADVFAAFTETGNIFDPETAEKARKYIYAAGNTVAPEELFRKFRGRDPDITFMLKKKGLV